jgi:DNA mismatch repair protein MutL
MLGPPAKISLLPEHLIDQIKAGEVIERPGSLLKEIIENSIDAGSTKIELTVLNNGLDLISLKDNGRGIFSQDLPLAFSRHATSKINRFEDLYQLGSFGFRGEALASIAAISKIQCLSFNKEEIDGREIRIEGGLTVYENSRQKIQGQTGLELNIQELFYNTPVRLKFIQSHQSEKNYIKKIIYSFVLSHPQVEFILKLNDDERKTY